MWQNSKVNSCCGNSPLTTASHNFSQIRCSPPTLSHSSILYLSRYTHVYMCGILNKQIMTNYPLHLLIRPSISLQPVRLHFTFKIVNVPLQGDYMFVASLVVLYPLKGQWCGRAPLNINPNQESYTALAGSGVLLYLYVSVYWGSEGIGWGGVGWRISTSSQKCNLWRNLWNFQNTKF